MDLSADYPRDLRGRAGEPFDPQWPDGARVAVSLVVNFETGSELSLANGDERNEFMYEIQEPVEGTPNYTLLSHFDYGARVGYWRIMRMLERFGAVCTLNAAGRAIERAPWVAKDALARGHEVTAHGYRWENVAHWSEADERAMIQKTVDVFEEVCGVRPLGWHSRGTPSPNTRRLAAELGFLYDSDCYDDDLPRVQEVAGRPYVLVPYAFDTNDMRFQAMPGGLFNNAMDYAQCCIDSFDALWEEGDERPSMMSVGLHPHYIGRPSRILGLTRFLEHVQQKGGAWITRRKDIAEHWLATFG